MTSKQGQTGAGGTAQQVQEKGSEAVSQAQQDGVAGDCESVHRG